VDVEFRPVDESAIFVDLELAELRSLCRFEIGYGGEGHIQPAFECSGGSETK